MSDESLRDLERAWRQERTVDSEARYLSEALRAGALTREQLGLAAYLYHEPAVAVVGPSGRTSPVHKPKGLHVWARGLAGFGSEATARVCLAEGRRLAARLRRAQNDSPESERIAVELRHGARLEEELSAWLLGASDSARLGRTASHALWDVPRGEEAWQRQAARMHQALACAASTLLGESRGPLVMGWGASPRQLLDVLRAELVPWCTGDYDPVRRRTEGVLERVQIASPCLASWEAMKGDDRTRHCLQCERNVYDLSALSREEAEALLAAQGEVCVRLYRRADGTVLTRDCRLGLEERTRECAPPDFGGALMGSVVPPDMFGDV
jgi:hypothetical protein